MIVLKELTTNNIDIIKTFFKDVFMREPWNDDWSDEEQLHCYIEDIIGNRNSLAFGLFEEEELLGLGTEFLRLLEENLKEKEIKTIFLMTGKEMPAFEFYRKNGFEEIINHVSLKKDI